LAHDEVAVERINAMKQTARAPFLISIVDDDAAVRDSLTNLLESAGLPTESFTSAEEFLASTRADRKSCLILDVKLPRMSGIELQQLLSSRSNSTPVIFITAHGDDNLRTQALSDGAVDFFHKPFDAEALLAAVETALTQAKTYNR
jgi:FixJ family two-component response regulator